MLGTTECEALLLSQEGRRSNSANAEFSRISFVAFHDPTLSHWMVLANEPQHFGRANKTQ